MTVMWLMGVNMKKQLIKKLMSYGHPSRQALTRKFGEARNTITIGSTGRDPDVLWVEVHHGAAATYGRAKDAATGPRDVG